MKHKTLDAVITALLPRPIPFHEHQRSLSSPHGLTLHLSNISQKSAHTSLGALFFWKSCYYANIAYLEIIIFHVCLPTILYVA